MEQPNIKWLCPPKETIEEAQGSYRYELFNPAAVFKTEKGFSMAYIREQDWPPHVTATAIMELTGWEMVSCCDPLLGVWTPYESN